MKLCHMYNLLSKSRANNRQYQTFLQMIWHSSDIKVNKTSTSDQRIMEGTTNYCMNMEEDIRGTAKVDVSRLNDFNFHFDNIK